MSAIKKLVNQLQDKHYIERGHSLMASVYHTVHVRIAIWDFLYNTSKSTFLFLSLPLKGRLGGVCKQVGGQARLPYSSPHAGRLGRVN